MSSSERSEKNSSPLGPRSLHYRAWDQSLRATWAALIARREFVWIRDEKAVERFVERMNQMSARLRLGRGL